MWLEKLKKTVVVSFKIFGTILVIFTLYICFVPPFGEIPRADRSKIEKIDPKNNALTEYNLAIKSLKNVSQVSHSIPNPENAKAILGEISLTERQKNFIEENKAAIAHIVEASKCSYFQFYDHIPSSSELTPNFIETNALTSLAALQARQLMDEDKINEAIEIALDNYKLATFLGTEPNLPSWVYGSMGRSGRAKSIAIFYYLLTQKDVKPEVLVNITRELQEIDKKLPTPYETLLREARLSQLSLDNCLIEHKEDKFLEDYFKVKYLPSGIRLRLYQGLMKRSQKNIALFTTPLKQWDFQSAKVARTLSEELSKSMVDGSLIDIIQQFSYYRDYSANYILRGSYFDKGCSKALQAFAVCVAYKKMHGHFPDNLQKAFEELKLEVPIDPVTDKPLGYRLEDNKPVVWLAGEDGQDNGGKENINTSFIDPAIEGKDIIFFFGEIPNWFKF